MQKAKKKASFGVRAINKAKKRLESVGKMPIGTQAKLDAARRLCDLSVDCGPDDLEVLVEAGAMIASVIEDLSVKTDDSGQRTLLRDAPSDLEHSRREHHERGDAAFTESCEDVASPPKNSFEGTVSTFDVRRGKGTVFLSGRSGSFPFLSNQFHSLRGGKVDYSIRRHPKPGEPVTVILSDDAEVVKVIASRERNTGF